MSVNDVVIRWRGRGDEEWLKVWNSHGGVVVQKSNRLLYQGVCVAVRMSNRLSEK